MNTFSKFTFSSPLLFLLFFYVILTSEIGPAKINGDRGTTSC